MTTSRFSMPRLSQPDMPAGLTDEDVQNNRFTVAALQRHKAEGLDLAIRARWAALAAVAILLPFLISGWQVLWPLFLLVLVALNGYVLRRVGRVGQSRRELFVIFIDLLLMTIALLLPNPLSTDAWPTAMIFHFDTFQYFLVILAVGTLSFSWRTILALGHWTSAMYLIGVTLIWYFGKTDPAMTAALYAAVPDDPVLIQTIDPSSVHWDRRIQEVVVFLIVTYALALTVRRFNRLILGNASLERERANLSRYFSPNVVEELSHNDEPLKQIKTHEVAVLFVDIVGFTTYAAAREPQEVIETLRDFHGRMENEVFSHAGTLDKFLGDGLMATFGTPVAGPDDARNALDCAMAMIEAVEDLNRTRKAAGKPEMDARFGLHYGPVVLGDIGANRLEFAVIGNTVNVASRLESLTRQIETRLIASDAVVQKAGNGTPATGLRSLPPQTVRGVSEPVPVWAMP